MAASAGTKRMRGQSETMTFEVWKGTGRSLAGKPHSRRIAGDAAGIIG
jgi:hypothetical protein